MLPSVPVTRSLEESSLNSNPVPSIARHGTHLPHTQLASVGKECDHSYTWLINAIPWGDVGLKLKVLLVSPPPPDSLKPRGKVLFGIKSFLLMQYKHSGLVSKLALLYQIIRDTMLLSDL